MPSPLNQVQQFGQSIWYDNISRGLIQSGKLARLVAEDGVRGVTSNPAIFEKAIGGSQDYDDSIRAAVGAGIGDPVEIFEGLAIRDIQQGCDVLRGVYDESGHTDGYVSLEVSPYLAHDSDGSVAEARRLWGAVDRENLMIKVPATPEGVPAIKQLISEGINVNVTLLFAIESYQAVADAYLSGLEERAARGDDLAAVSSVASFFVSRIDASVGKRLAEQLENEKNAARRSKLEGLDGKVAIANAKLAYAAFQGILSSPRWQSLAAKGAQPQRMLWASTGTKTPELPRTLYVDNLIGPHTVNTLPGATFEAFREEGIARDALGVDFEASLSDARQIMGDLEEVGIPFKEIADELLTNGCQLFNDAFDQLLGAVAEKRVEILADTLSHQSLALGEYEREVQANLDEWRAAGKTRRLWAGDASLWSGDDEASWLGWLDVVRSWQGKGSILEEIAEHAGNADVEHVVVMGMGGSSLCPDVLRRTFAQVPGFPELLVLDSTVPAQVASLRAQIDPARTLFIVPSKSGGTIEPNSFKAYFWDETENAAERFMTITDPGTRLDQLSQEEGLSLIAYGTPTIGGRFSALSAFGMVPAAALGLDVEDLLSRTQLMVDACGASVPPEQNPGIRLGISLGTLARQGRDKLTIIASPAMESLGAWLEQLIAESTGKDDRGIVPVDGEALATPDHYGPDRVFVQIRLADEVDPDQDAAIGALASAGHPVIRIEVNDKRDLGQEFFRWEMATAAAGAILEINPFNQPDVEAAKLAALALMESYEETGVLPTQSARFEADGISIYADDRNQRASAGDDLPARLRAHLGRLSDGDYFAINAYIEMNDAHDAPLQQLRLAVRDGLKAATTLGYGPRFLHSTGQLHKGGSNRGVFVQITADDARDLAIPGQRYTFGVLKDAQAQGDFDVLAERNRRALRIHLGSDVAAGLRKLVAAFETALAS